MTSVLLQTLSPEQASSVASLVAMGSQSGATILGLSGVRRCRQLALVLVDVSISENTQSELARLSEYGVRVFRVEGLSAVTSRMGREDVHVLGVRAGDLANGILAKLPAPSKSSTETDSTT